MKRARTTHMPGPKVFLGPEQLKALERAREAPSQTVHVTRFEKDFSEYVARAKKRNRPEAEEYVREMLREEIITGKRSAVSKKNPAILRMLADLVELDVVDYFLRKTENERPDSEKLAMRTHELRQRGYLARGRWVMKRFGSKVGAHWVVVPKQ